MAEAYQAIRWIGNIHRLEIHKAAQARYAEGGRGTRSVPWDWFQAAEWPDLLKLTGKEKP